MSIIKEIYDVSKDAAKFKSRIKSVKKALKTELKLNQKFLSEVGKSQAVNDERRKKIIQMLEINELADAIKYDIPYKLISRKKVTPALAAQYRIKRISGFDFEKLIENQYLKIAYLKKDFDNPRINLNARLLNIYKQNSILLELLD